MLIGALQKTTLVDFPGKIACVVFTVGCNFRCGYCHNPELLKHTKDSPQYHEADFFEFLLSRKGKLEGVCITGGEPTIQPDLLDFISRIKKMGFLVKLDTQGSHPNILKELLEKELVDYVAMDIKGPLSRYKEITNSNIDPESVAQSIGLLMDSGIEYEFRTTVVKDQLTEKDFEQIGKQISGAKRYYLQKFIPTKTNDESFMERETLADDEFSNVIGILSKHVNVCDVR